MPETPGLLEPGRHALHETVSGGILGAVQTDGFFARPLWQSVSWSWALCGGGESGNVTAADGLRTSLLQELSFFEVNTS